MSTMAGGKIGVGGEKSGVMVNTDSNQHTLHPPENKKKIEKLK